MSSIALVIGAAGFIGRHVCRQFAGAGYEVAGVDSSPPEHFPAQDLVATHTMRLPDNRLDRLLAELRPSLVVNCAGRASVEYSMSEPADDFRQGPVLTFELLESIRRQSPKSHYVFLSSAAIFGNPSRLPVDESCPANPISAYGFHKLQSESICTEFRQLFGIRTSVMRIFSAFGPGLRKQVVWDICRKSLTEPELMLHGTGEEGRDFIYVRDVARAVLSVHENGPELGDIFNVGSGEETKIGHLARLLVTALNLQVTPRYNGQMGQGIPTNWCADISKLLATGYVPSVPLEVGLRNVANWCLAELTV